MPCVSLYVNYSVVYIYIPFSSGLLELSLTWIYYEKPENNIRHLFQQNLFIDQLGDDMGLFVYVLSKIAFWYVVCWILYKKKLFFKI